MAIAGAQYKLNHRISLNFIQQLMQSREGDKMGLLAKHDNIIIQEKNSSGAIIRKYVRGKFLGKGGFAKCYEICEVDGHEKRAVKVIEKASLTRSKAREKLNSEIKIHRSLRSEFVVGFHHFFEDQYNVYIILELCSHQTLNELMKRRRCITEVEAKYYMHQIILGVKDIHCSNVIHRDLKLGNLFLTERLQVKIGDFGLAAKLNYDAERRRTMCGTPNYIAPQILQSNNGHSFQVDVWSLGVIAFAFVCGRPPFETNDVKTTYQKIRNCNYSFPESISLSHSAKRFISRMLIKDPSRRATIDELLSDDFFTRNSFPRSLPICLSACPPNSAFLKQYSEAEEQTNHRLSIEKTAVTATSRGILERKESREQLHTDRILQKDKERDSLGRVMVRASSIDRVDHKQQVVQRACSTNALLLNKKKSFTKESFQVGASVSNHGQGPHIWVAYYEENPKFGICYILNSNATGMKFNDSTYLISNSNFTRIKYNSNTRDSSAGQVYDLSKTPEILNKKIKIISHYQKELKKRKQQEEASITNEERINREKLRYKQTQESAMQVFVVKHYKTTKVNIFWFNNKDFQVIFKDFTEILVSKDKYITYVNKLAERKYFFMSDLSEQPEQTKKRMNYTLTLMQSIKESNAQRNIENEPNKENQQPPQMVRSSSVVKMERLQLQPTLTKSSSTATRFLTYKNIK